MNIKIINNFLNEEDYKELTSLNLEEIKENEIKVYHNKINSKDEIDVQECLNDHTLKRLFKKFLNYVKRNFVMR